MKNLVIVESPSKSKTIEKYLGGDYHVVSSKGHIRDLATTGKGGLGIDVENGFIPNYIISSGRMFWFCSRMFEGVATCDMTIINVRCMYARISCRSSFSSSKARMTPSVAFSSSRVPFVSIRISSLSTRLPPNIPVVPLSPPFVYILMLVEN